VNPIGRFVARCIRLRWSVSAQACWPRLKSSLRQPINDRCLAMFQLVKRRDKEMANIFDDMRRSTAWQTLAIHRSRDLLTDAEYARFSPETRDAVQIFLGR
jgi:hypothetical protein